MKRHGTRLEIVKSRSECVIQGHGRGKITLVNIEKSIELYAKRENKKIIVQNQFKQSVWLSKQEQQTKLCSRMAKFQLNICVAFRNALNEHQLSKHATFTRWFNLPSITCTWSRESLRNIRKKKGGRQGLMWWQVRRQRRKTNSSPRALNKIVYEFRNINYLVISVNLQLTSLKKFRSMSVMSPNTKTIAPPICKKKNIHKESEPVLSIAWVQWNFFFLVLLTKIIKLLINIPYLTRLLQKSIRPPTPIMTELV